jgi:hypothetical protein
MNSEWFIIKSLEELVNYSRVLVYNNYGSKKTPNTETSDNQDSFTNIDDLVNITSENEEELNSLLSFEESSIIVKSFIKKQINRKTSKTRYLISDNIFNKVLEALGDRMTSNILNNLVNKGLIETAFDEERNDFIFWVKDENNTEKPETD